MNRDEQFSAFYERHWSAVAGYCTGLARSTDIGDELAQEAFTRLYPRWPRLDEPLPYVFRIAHNLACDHFARADRDRRHRPATVLAPSGSIDEPGDSRDIGLAAGGELLGTDLLDAIKRLPKGLRDVTLLHYYADLTIRDVALATGRAEGTVKRQLHEARSALAVALEEAP